jgi:AcrR family transcriptional regulator
MVYMKSEVRKEHILDAAMKAAEKVGYLSMRRSDVAELAGCAEGLVNKYFNTMPQLRRAVMRKAVSGGYNAVLAQGLACKDPVALRAAKETKRLAGQSLLG